MTVYPWRCWLAFEVRPGISRQRSGRLDGRAIAASCRGPDGKLDVGEFEHWLDCISDHDHLWGQA